MNATIEAQLDSIPDSLKAHNQWVCWRYDRPANSNSHRWCKVPISPVNGRNAKTTLPSSWSNFGKATTFLEENRSCLAGIGFVFTDDDPFVGIDLDHCRDIEKGSLSQWAGYLIDQLDSYTEVSPSGTGVKTILESTTKISSRRKSSPGIEVYSSDRFFTITGHAVDNRLLINDRTDRIQQVHRELFSGASADVDSTSPILTSPPSAPDNQILMRAFAAKNGLKFRQLWEGVLSHHGDDASSADQSLCCRLAFWCGPCPDQIDRLFRRSALFRPKWDEVRYADGSTYGQVTVAKAIEFQGESFFNWPAGKNRVR